MESTEVGKIWANSGDSHIIEPPTLFDSLPPHLKELMPRSVKSADGATETIYLDGQEFTRALPQAAPGEQGGRPPRMTAMPKDTDVAEAANRHIQANDAEHRLKDADNEGIWAEVIYPSLGIWASNLRTPELAKRGSRLMNEFALDFQNQSERFVCTASIPMLNVDDAVAEIKRASADGFLGGFLPVLPPIGRPDWHHEEWDPMWDAFADTGMRICIHIGTEPLEPTERTGVYFRGRGGAVLNYVETTYGGQKMVTKLIASGVLDQRRELKVLVSEGGATWGPFLADRMTEGYRQHSAGVRPVLNREPAEILYEQVYASFQHDSSAILACSAMGWQNVMWGSDYPHFEGTFGHTQETLHGLFDGVDEKISHRIRIGAFQELFPTVPLPAFAA